MTRGCFWPSLFLLERACEKTKTLFKWTDKGIVVYLTQQCTGKIQESPYLHLPNLDHRLASAFTMEEIISTRAQLQKVDKRLGEWVARGSIQSSRIRLPYPQTPGSTPSQDHALSGWCDTCEAPESFASPVNRSISPPSSDESPHISDSSHSRADRNLDSSSGDRSCKVPEPAASVTGGNAISPDSSIACDDPTCPIGIPHNKGRFYYHGKKADEPTDDELSASQAPPAHFFNFTVPTPEIARAYRRMTEGKASVEDREFVMRYVRMHIYSPIVSAPATPKIQVLDAQPERIPCLILDLKEQDTEKQARQFEMIEKHLQVESDQTIDSGDAVSPPTHEEVMQVESDAAQETRPPTPPNRRSKRAQKRSNAAYSGRMKLQRTGQTADLREVSGDQERAHLRTLPEGECLRDAQVSIQEKIINQIAQRAIEESSEGDSEVSDSSGSRLSQVSKVKPKVEANEEGSNRDSLSDAGNHATWVTEEEPEEIDRKVEVHAALTKKLRQDLLDGTFRNIHIGNQEGKPVDREMQFQYVNDILLLIRRSLKHLLGDFDREYRPTSLEVTDDELGELAEKLKESYEVLLARYPSMKIKDILWSLDSMGPRDRLENVF